METKEIISAAKTEFRTAATEAGVTPEKINKYGESPRESNYLPNEGTFESVSFSGDGNFLHPRMLTTGGGSISFSCIQIVGFIASSEDDKPQFGKSGDKAKHPGMLYLKGSALNAFAQCSKEDLYERLKGRKFTAVEKKVSVMDNFIDNVYTPVGDEDEARKRIIVKDCYLITLS